MAIFGLPMTDALSVEKQLAALNTHRGAIRTPVQVACSPILILATKFSAPGASEPVRALEGATEASAASAVTALVIQIRLDRLKGIVDP
ncbi:hypothetical protein ACWEP8_33295 [Streptomyces hydrogenans]